MKSLALLLIVCSWCVASVCASSFSVRYDAAARQIWCIIPLAEKGAHRFCVLELDPDGVPRKGVIADDARFSGGAWSIRSGRELILDEKTLEPLSMKRITGAQSGLTLDPASNSRDPRIKEIGTASVFSEKSSGPAWVNPSIFTFEEKSRILTYLFARRAVIDPEKEEKALKMSGILMVRTWPDSRPPEVLNAERFQ